MYSNRFYSILKEQPGDMPPEALATPVEPTGQDAMASTLDTGTPADAFDDVAPNPEVQMKQARVGAQTQKISEWIGKIEDFVTYLNGVDGNSMQAQLHSAECDTIFNNIATAETKKIARIAQDLRGLSEALKGYLMAAKDDS